jgi:hypothetical protein
MIRFWARREAGGTDQTGVRYVWTPGVESSFIGDRA